MDTATARQLHERNRVIIGAVIAKAERVCPDALDLIAITGSFASGDFYEKSDLDLLIVIGDERGYRLARCFLLGDVAHDLYCQRWEQLEQTAAYPDPYVGKLLDAEIVYTRNEAVRERYLALRDRLRQTLARPLCPQELNTVREHLDAAVQAYGRLCLEPSPARRRYHAAGVVYRLEYALYLLNKAYIRHGVRGIPQEICALPILPPRFEEHYRALIDAVEAEEVQRLTGWLIRAVEALLREKTRDITPVAPLTRDVLRGTYEEVHSNWRNKMHRAAREGDAYLSWMTAAAAQEFYEDMTARGTPVIELFVTEEDSLRDAAERFDAAMARYLECYTQTGTPLCRFDGVEDFINDYLNEI